MVQNRRIRQKNCRRTGDKPETNVGKPAKTREQDKPKEYGRKPDYHGAKPADKAKKLPKNRRKG